MSKSLVTAMFILAAATALLCGLVPIVRGQTRSDDTLLETIGKENPFEMVRPIAEVKRSVVQRITSAESAADSVMDAMPELMVETVMIKFLRAASLEPAMSRLLSSRGHVSIDEATNTLIIAETVENMDRVLAEIRKADRTPPQVMIEVVIVDVQLGDTTEIGVNWEHLLGRGRTENYTQRLATTLTTPGTRGVDFSFIVDGIKPTIHALQQVRNVEILASPKVMVVSGQEAMIQTVEEIPYSEQSDTSGGGSLTSTEFKEVGVTLKVLAHVMDDNKIKITVEPEQSVNTGRFGQSNQNSVPIIDTRRARTTLLMDDGQVVVIGGLRRKTKRLATDKVPILGDLPLVGFLFSNDNYEIENSELMVFLSPHIHTRQALDPSQSERYNSVKDLEHLDMPQLNRPEFEIISDIFEPITIKE